jgi:hypothetical protein
VAGRPQISSINACPIAKRCIGSSRNPQFGRTGAAVLQAFFLDWQNGFAAKQLKAGGGAINFGAVSRRPCGVLAARCQKAFDDSVF